VDPLERREGVQRCSPLMVDDGSAWAKYGTGSGPPMTGSGQEAWWKEKGDVVLYC
jgi:hypothetical protein